MLHFSWRRLVWYGVFAGLGELYAADGVILIDQNIALTGNVTPGDEPGFPVTISQPGSYRLSGNLTVGDINTTAIQIAADSVTLDLNGFSISGPAVCTNSPTTCSLAGQGFGVLATVDQGSAPRAVRVRNGSVRGMGVGISLAGDGSFVEKVDAYSNAGGGIAVAGSVMESAAIQNGSFGIIALAVRDSTALQNAGDGIILDGTGGVAIGNVSSFNGGYGISVSYGTVTGNTMLANKSFGISASCPSTIADNTIVASEAATVETKRAGCVQSNNAVRP